MSDIFLLLGQEVERLVTSPYAPSLQTLYSLTQQALPSVLSAWAYHKPCQVGPLVDILVDGLAYSRLAFPLLTSLARAPGFRESLLRRHPHILDQFLQQTTGDEETDYLPICLSLLSSPLPYGLTPPASLASFVSLLIQNMRNNASAETVRPLYLISSCLQASGVLFELPQEVMTCFQTELTKTLRNLDNHMGNLLCLATFARLGSPQSSGVDTTKITEVPSWLQSIKHFFGAKRGLKTLDLVVLRVILACSSNYGNLTTEQSAESIRLGIEICGSVDRAQRECWIEGNPVKLTKLIEKITRDDIDQRVQMLGVSFLASLVSTASLPPHLARISLEWLVSNDTAEVLEIFPSDSLTRLVRANAACSGQFTVTKVLEFITSTLSTQLGENRDMARLRMAKLLLGGLHSSVPTSPDSPTSQIDAALRKHDNAILDVMQSFPRQPCQSRCDGSPACYAAASNLENDLLFDLLTFWLEAALLRNDGQGAPCPVGMTTMRRFMSKGKGLLPEAKCLFSEAKPLDLRASFSSLKTRETVNPPRGDWRNGIRGAMEAAAQIMNDSIMRKVEDACYELEQRCSNIESPLRAAEEERSRHALEAERLKEQNDNLQSQLQQAADTIAELREEMARLGSHATSATERARELSDILNRERETSSNRMAELREEMSRLDRLAGSASNRAEELSDTLARECESARMKELDMFASLTEKDDRLEELQKEIKCQTNESARLRETLATASMEKVSFLQDVAALKDEVSNLETELESSKTIISQKDEEIVHLIAKKESAEKSTDDLQKKWSEEVSTSESLRTTLRDTTENFKAQLEDLRRQSELQYSKMNEEAMVKTSEIKALQRAMDESASNASRELQTKDKRIQHLERKMQHLREERAAKAREFSEAQQHISRLMGVMGFKPTSDGLAQNKQRSRPSLEPSQSATTRAQTDSGDGIFQSQDLLATSVDSTTSPHGGRSPKRSRNSAFPSAQPSPSGSHESSSRKSRGPVHRRNSKQYKERKPLGEADQNSRSNSQGSELSPHHSQKSSPASQSNIQNQHHLDGIDLDLDLEFSKDFVFTSTSMSEMNGHAGA